MQLTREEKKWLEDVQNLLDKCPSDRLGFFTIGDANLTVYDRRKDLEIDDIQDTKRRDFCNAVEDVDARITQLTFPSSVHSTSG
ncbi:hypothetical protein [Sulfitobacter sp. R18_1]|uniref:hypothetical protein n=1 Tax=Sulfitobacter sp. R18_1 TaxID=2821104 RepID=UPI001AD9BA37|nr:hypothetical protein [Sulfitobacter sp. R18_1]MBO9427887.1 hypothetical protein [Sulfitobacter sp. R18_1]